MNPNPLIVKTGNVSRGTVQTIHVQTGREAMTRLTLCGRRLNSIDWRTVSDTEFRGQMLLCARCKKA